LTQPRRVVDIFPALFTREITGGILGMATGESFAHLNRLEAEGKAVSKADADGVLWWLAASPEAPLPRGLHTIMLFKRQPNLTQVEFMRWYEELHAPAFVTVAKPQI